MLMFLPPGFSHLCVEFPIGHQFLAKMWCMPIIPTFRKLKQGDYKFEVIPGYIMRLSQKREGQEEKE